MAAVRIDHLVVRRKRTTALDDVDLTVAEGSRTGLLGPSGSGKMPLRYGVDGMGRLVGATTVSATVWWDLVVIAGCAVLALGVGATTLRRTTA